MRLYSKKYVLDYIKENYDGTNVKKLSRDLGYTEKWIKQIIYKSNIDK